MQNVLPASFVMIWLAVDACIFTAHNVHMSSVVAVQVLLRMER